VRAAEHTGGIAAQRYGETMSGAIDEIKREWKAFKTDAPGKRFEHQHDRMKRANRGARIGLAITGALIVAIGIALLVLPGPGLLFVVFGLALLAGLSGTLARGLDRVEPKIRKQAKLMRRGWRQLSGAAKVGAGALGALGAAAIAFGAYHLIIT
jgi:hypothetical protein